MAALYCRSAEEAVEHSRADSASTAAVMARRARVTGQTLGAAVGAFCSGGVTRRHVKMSEVKSCQYPGFLLAVIFDEVPPEPVLLELGVDDRAEVARLGLVALEAP